MHPEVNEPIKINAVPNFGISGFRIEINVEAICEIRHALGKIVHKPNGYEDTIQSLERDRDIALNIIYTLLPSAFERVGKPIIKDYNSSEDKTSKETKEDEE